MVTSSGGDEIAVSKYSVQDGDQKRTVSTRVDDVIRAIVELGGTYPDVVQALQEAKNAGALASRFEVDALPEAGRTYHRTADLFAKRPDGGSTKAAAGEKSDDKSAQDDDSDDSQEKCGRGRRAFLVKCLVAKRAEKD